VKVAPAINLEQFFRVDPEDLQPQTQFMRDQLNFAEWMAIRVWRAMRGHSVLGTMFLCAQSMLAVMIPTGRTANWTQAGVAGGIPFYAVFANVKSAPYNAVGNGVADDTTAIRNALNACPEGQAVYLPAGTYKISSDLQTDKGIVIRGAGMGQTFLTGASIKFARSSSVGSFDNSMGTGVIANITAGATSGSNTLTVSDSSYMQVGAYVVIGGEDPAVSNPSGYESTWYSPVMGQVSRITAMNGKTITIDPALYWGLPTKAVTSIRQSNSHPGANYLQGGGVEALTLDNGGGTYGIWIENAANSWVESVEIEHYQIAAIRCLYVSHCELLGNYLHDTLGDGSGGGYGILMEGKSTACLIDNNISYMNTTSWMLDDGATGNVVSYNYTADTKYYQSNWLSEDFNSHSAHPMFNLWEGNVGYNFYADDIHGSSSHHTLFRNVFKGWKSTTDHQNFAIGLDAYQWYVNVVGNVLGTSGQTKTYQLAPPAFEQYIIYGLGYNGSRGYDPNTLATLYRHGNYDTVNAAVLWDPTNSDHAIAASLYLSSKPSWWGILPWPAIGPDLNPMVGQIPAVARYIAGQPGIALGSGQPAGSAPVAPANLRIVSP
jgi:hypothetical protein